MITCALGFLLVLNSPLQAQAPTYHDLNVAIGAAPSLREINWDARGELTSGTWGVSSESFLGFTLTALLDGGTDGAQLSYESASNRTLGVASTLGTGRIIYRTNEPIGKEAIQLDLPAKDAPGVVSGHPDRTFAGISQIAIDRLSQGAGNIVTISGFVADPQASWAIAPGLEASLVYSGDTLTFETGRGTEGWTPVGVLQFANLGATLSETGVSLVFSNDRANNNNPYGLVGWQYATDGEDAPPRDALTFAGVGEGEIQDGFVTLQGLGLVYLEHYPWVHHSGHGWLWSAMTSWAEGGWFFDAQSGDWWASTALAYPWKVRDDSGWSLD
jgi:hypothetical protein